MAILQESYMASVDMPWPFYSGEQIVAYGPLVLISAQKYMLWVLIRSALHLCINKKNINSFWLKKVSYL